MLMFNKSVFKSQYLYSSPKGAPGVDGRKEGVEQKINKKVSKNQ